MDKLSPRSERQVTAAFGQAVEEALTLAKPVDAEKGGLLRLYFFKVPHKTHADLAEVYFSPWTGGPANQDKEDKYTVFTCEKAIRLSNEYGTNGHISSGQSANAAKFLADGASIVECSMPSAGPSLLIPSVSGWAPHVDAAIGLRTMQLMEGWYPRRGSLAAVIAATKNEFAAQLLRFGYP